MSDQGLQLQALPGSQVGPGLVDAAAILHGSCFSPGWNGAAFQALLGMPGVILITGIGEGTGGAMTGLLLARAAADEAEILTICVDPEHRGAGIGIQLVQHMRDILHRDGIRQLFLEVAEGNHAALGLYHRCGFRIVGRRDAYYADGQNAVIMRRTDKV